MIGSTASTAQRPLVGEAGAWRSAKAVPSGRSHRRPAPGEQRVPGHAAEVAAAGQAARAPDLRGGEGARRGAPGEESVAVLEGPAPGCAGCGQGGEKHDRGRHRGDGAGDEGVAAERAARPVRWRTARAAIRTMCRLRRRRPVDRRARRTGRRASPLSSRAGRYRGIPAARSDDARTARGSAEAFRVARAAAASAMHGAGRQRDQGRCQPPFPWATSWARPDVVLGRPQAGQPRPEPRPSCRAYQGSRFVAARPAADHAKKGAASRTGRLARA